MVPECQEFFRKITEFLIDSQMIDWIFQEGIRLISLEIYMMFKRVHDASNWDLQEPLGMQKNRLLQIIHIEICNPHSDC